MSPDETSSLYYDFSFPRLPCYPNLDIGHSLNPKTTFNEVDHRFIKESHLPAVQEADHEPSTVTPVPVPAVAEIFDEHPLLNSPFMTITMITVI